MKNEKIRGLFRNRIGKDFLNEEEVVARFTQPIEVYGKPANLPMMRLSDLNVISNKKIQCFKSVNKKDREMCGELEKAISELSVDNESHIEHAEISFKRFIETTESILKDGLRDPLQVTINDNGGFDLASGRHRALGFSLIYGDDILVPVVVISTKTKKDAQLISYEKNTNNRDPSLIETLQYKRTQGFYKNLRDEIITNKMFSLLTEDDFINNIIESNESTGKNLNSFLDYFVPSLKNKEAMDSIVNVGVRILMIHLKMCGELWKETEQKYGKGTTLGDVLFDNIHTARNLRGLKALAMVLRYYLYTSKEEFKKTPLAVVDVVSNVSDDELSNLVELALKGLILNSKEIVFDSQDNHFYRVPLIAVSVFKVGYGRNWRKRYLDLESKVLNEKVKRHLIRKHALSSKFNKESELSELFN